MAMRTLLISDGRGRTVVVDRSDAVERYRYRCPEGHVDWYPTNSHLYCESCNMAHYHIVDQKTGDAIHWSDVRLTETGETTTA